MKSPSIEVSALVASAIITLVSGERHIPRQKRASAPRISGAKSTDCSARARELP
jgi:hypothetical protein